MTSTVAQNYLADMIRVGDADPQHFGRDRTARLAQWGQALFEGLFGAGKPGRDAYLKSREAVVRVGPALALAVLSETLAEVGLTP